MRPPETQRRPGQRAAAVSAVGQEIAAEPSAPVAYVKLPTLLRLIARIVPAKTAPRRAPLRCGRRARA
jgi:hypothetical protein